MPKVNIHLKKELFVPKFYPYLTDYSKRWFVMMGSAGSAKSYFITQRILYRCVHEPIKILVCRRYGSTIRNTVFSLFKDVISKWHLTPYVKIRETDFNIRFWNGSEIIFMGLDEETKLLSLNNIGSIWIEEAYEVPQNMIEQLNLRMRGNTPNQQIMMSFNPISKNHYLYDFCEVNPPESFEYIHSTYKDNPFLPDDYVRALDEMATRNPNKYRVFGLGEWGVNTDALVITNWKAEEFDPIELGKTLEHRVGMDLGFVDKTAIINTLYDKDNHRIYVFEEFYKSGCQLSEISEAINSMTIGKTKIYCDAAEPRSIQYFRNEGHNAVPCLKGKDSIKAGLMFLQDNELIVSPQCQNFITELENFSYIKSKQTGEYTDDTTHEWSHAIDACRYGYSDIYTQKKLKTLSKMSLGL